MLLSIGYMLAVIVLVQVISDNESHKLWLELLHDSDFGRSTSTVSKCYKPKWTEVCGRYSLSLSLSHKKQQVWDFARTPPTA